jgi:hypothetical protein
MIDKPKNIPQLTELHSKNEKVATSPTSKDTNDIIIKVESPNNQQRSMTVSIKPLKPQTTLKKNNFVSFSGFSNVADLESNAENIKSQIAKNLIISIQPKSLLEFYGDSILLVDMRPESVFTLRNIKNSINPSFPALVVKRFRKKIFSSFNLVNFLSNIDDQNRFNKWKQTEGEKLIIVYDEHMEMEHFDSDAWAFVSALYEGIGPEFFRNQTSPKIGYFMGGFEALSNQQKMYSALFMGINSFSDNLDFISKPITTKKMGKTNLSLNFSTIKGNSKSNSEKKSLNLSIIASNSLASANSALKTSAENLNALTPGSPADNARIPEPYSKVNDTIYLGSDVIPLATDGPERLDALGVTHILNMAAEIETGKAIVDSGKFKLKWIQIYDNAEVDMDDALQEAIAFIGI